MQSSRQKQFLCRRDNMGIGSNFRRSWGMGKALWGPKESSEPTPPKWKRIRPSAGLWLGGTPARGNAKTDITVWILFRSFESFVIWISFRTSYRQPYVFPRLWSLHIDIYLSMIRQSHVHQLYRILPCLVCARTTSSWECLTYIHVPAISPCLNFCPKIDEYNLIQVIDDVTNGDHHAAHEQHLWQYERRQAV